jgi:phosphatidate cytidylyltransferase
MNIEIKKRLSTSALLLLLFLTIFFNNFILLFCLILIFAISSLEFFAITSIIYRKSSLKAFFVNIIYVVYIFLITSIFFLFSLSVEPKNVLFFIILICIFSDIGGLLFGKLFKGPKLTNISPNKTISGSVGSLFFSSLVSVATYLILFKSDYSYIYIYIFFSIFVSIGCQLGDLFFSFLKRKSKLQDTGSLLPGHGGILDRIDGMLLGLPFGLIFIVIWSPK